MATRRDGGETVMGATVCIEFARRLERERDEARKIVSQLLDHNAKLSGRVRRIERAVRAFRRAKGRHNTEQACRALVALLPENGSSEVAGGGHKPE